MKTAFRAAACFSIALLSACGGNNQQSVSPGAAINLVTADQVAWRQTTTFTITGQSLDLGYTVTAPGCANIKAVSTTSTTQQTYSCKLIGVGAQSVSFSPKTGVGSGYNLTLTVPLQVQPQVTMTTSLGNIVIQLSPQKAPLTVDNFLNYVESGFYANTIFHRVMPTGLSVIQGGGYYKDLTAAPNLLPPITLENNGLTNVAGTIAMARTSDPNSATSQFFFNVAANPALDSSSNYYAVFGNVVGTPSQSVLTAISQVATQTVNANFQNVPVTPVVITSVTRTQ